MKRKQLLTSLTLLLMLVVFALPVGAKNNKNDKLSWLLKQHTIATGALNAPDTAEKTVYQVNAGGMSGTLTEYDAPPRKYRVEMELGPLTIVTADDGLHSWEQDSSGNVRIISGDELTENRATANFSLENVNLAKATKNAVVKLRTKQDPQTKDYILDITPQDGNTQIIYINPKSFLVDKLIVNQSGITGTIKISSYKTIDRVKIPAHLDISYSGLPLVISAELQSSERLPKLNIAIFRVPESARDYTILQANADGSITFPFTLEDNEIIVPVTINGQKQKFILDSGAASSFITSTAAKDLNLSLKGNVAAVGYGGTTKTGIATNTEITLGDSVKLKKQILYVVQDQLLGKKPDERAKIDPSLRNTSALTADGGLGYDIFTRFIVRIDYPQRLITLIEADATTKPQLQKTKGTTISIKLQNHTPTIVGCVDGKKQGRFLIDTGDSGYIHIYNKYAAANKLTPLPNDKNVVTRMGVGIGGVVKESITQGHKASIGSLSLTQVPVATITGVGLSDFSTLAGGVGNGILSKFAVTFDYSTNRLILEQPAGFTNIVGYHAPVRIDTPLKETSPKTNTDTKPQSPIENVTEPDSPKIPAAQTSIAPTVIGVESRLALDSLLDRHIVALGGRPAVMSIHNTRITAEIETGGIKGKVTTTYAEPDNEYEQDDLGIIKVIQGYNGKVSWRLDANGNMRPLASDELSNLRNQIFFDSNSYLRTDRIEGKMSLRTEREKNTGNYIIDITPNGGKPTIIYIDPVTYLIVKEQHKDDDVLTTTVFTNYKNFNGVKFPTKQRINSGDSRYDITLNVLNIETNIDIDNNIFTPPSTLHNAYFIKPNTTSVTIPFTLDSGEISFDVQVNKRKMRMLLDSGASSIAISHKIADDLGIKQNGVLEARGYGGSTDLHPIVLNTLEIANAIRFTDISAVSVNMPLTMLKSLDKATCGFIGYDLLSKFVVTVDYAAQKLTITDPSAYKQDHDNGFSLPVELDNDIPAIHATLDNLPPARYLVDSGDVAALRLFGPYVSAHKLTSKYPNGKKTAGGGIAGLSEALMTNVEHFRIADIDFEQVPAEFSLDTKGGVSELNAGSIGYGLLSQMKVTFDYPHNKIYFMQGKPITSVPVKPVSKPVVIKHNQ